MNKPDAAGTNALWQALLGQASAPYLKAGRFAWHFARGKLGRDPVFRTLLERGALAPGARVVDIGCGQALLSSLMHACHAHVHTGAGAASPPSPAPAQRLAQSLAAGATAWPVHWGAAPVARHYHGIELMPRDIERGQNALASWEPGVIGTQRCAFSSTLVCADMREASLPPCDAVVILDVLHYVDHAAQAALLARVKAALLAGLADRQTPAPAPQRLLLRIGDAGERKGYAMSQWVDRLVTHIRGHRVPPTFGRPLGEWVALLQSLGFAVQSLPMSQGTPFANVLLWAELPTQG